MDNAPIGAALRPGAHPLPSPCCIQCIPKLDLRRYQTGSQIEVKQLPAQRAKH